MIAAISIAGSFAVCLFFYGFYQAGKRAAVREIVLATKTLQMTRDKILAELRAGVN